MAKGFKRGTGAGNSLNFKVIAYAAEDELNSATPMGNVVGVITTDKITSWAFIATEPEAPEEGMVWFSTDRISSTQFNALKKNGIQLYPFAAKQYIGGAWVDKIAKTWLDGAWVDWLPRGALYWDGIQAVDWIAKNSVGQSSWTAVAPTFGDSTVTISPGEYANKFCGIVTNDKVDITGYTKLVIEFESIAGIGGATTLSVHISTKQTEWLTGSSTVATKTIESNPGNVVELPFTASGSYYIDIFCIRTAVVKIKRVYLEK